MIHEYTESFHIVVRLAVGGSAISYMDDTSCTTNSTFHDSLICILLTLNLYIRIKRNGAKPIIRVIFPSGRLAVNSHTFNILQQLFIEFLNMLMVSYVIVNDSHLATTNTSANITHTVVISYLLVLIVRIALTVLCSIHHYLAPVVFVLSNQCTTARSSNHLITIKRQDTVFTKCTKHLSVELRAKAFSSIFNKDFAEYSPEYFKEPNWKSEHFTFLEGGKKVLVVELLSRKSNAKRIRALCRQQGIPYLRFYYDYDGWWNTRAYVVGRVNKALGK